MSILFSMVVFSFVMSITPGPVNLIIVSSGITVGFKRTFAFVSGATIGFTLLLILCACGLVNFVNETLLNYLSIFSVCFLIYIGVKIFNYTDLKIENNSKSPTFIDGFLLQFLNPKAWLACISGVSIFSENLFIFVLIYFLICYICLSFWAYISHKVNIIFHLKKNLKYLNRFMGSLLIIISLYFVYKNLIG